MTLTMMLMAMTKRRTNEGASEAETSKQFFI